MAAPSRSLAFHEHSPQVLGGDQPHIDVGILTCAPRYRVFHPVPFGDQQIR